MRHQPPAINRRRARDLRAEATLAESLLWQAVRDRRLEGFKFRRQVPLQLQGYILDFVCFEARLVVELDGSQHAESPADERRDAVFRTQRFRVLRFWSDEVTENLNAVCLAILSELRNCGEGRQ